MSRMLALALLTVAVTATTAAATEATLPDIEDEVMCPVCGTPLELAEAPQADQQRALIRRLINQGRSKEEIKDALVAEYGPEVLATPDDRGFDLVAWLAPAILLPCVVLMIVVLIRRSRTGAKDAETTERPLNTSESRRLDTDLSRWDD